MGPDGTPAQGSPDGERFLVVIADAGNEEIRVILNWLLLLQDADR